MNTITIHNLQRIKLPELLDQLPMMVTADGTVVGMLAAPQDVIVLSDLHVRVQHQLRSQEAKARAGMATAAPAKVGTGVVLDADIAALLK